MKKTAAISIAAFYLLAATGMFVCIVHCAAESLLTGKKTAYAEEIGSDHHDSYDQQDHHEASSKKDKDCKGEEGCSCCDQHGTYVVKENISPTLNLKVPEILLVGYQPLHFSYSTIDKVISLPYIWPESHAPPGKNDQHLYIKIRSLLI